MSDVTTEQLRVLEKQLEILRTRKQERFSDKWTVQWLRAQPTLGTTHPRLIELMELEAAITSHEEKILSLSASDIPPKPDGSEKRKRQSRIDMEAVQTLGLSKITEDQHIPLKDLADLAHKEQPGSSYDLRTLMKWLRTIRPEYTEGRPGRKKKNQ